MVKLKAFHKFDNTSELQARLWLIQSLEISSQRNWCVFCYDLLHISDIECVHNDAVMELLRGVRSQLTELLSGLDDNDLAPVSLELSHILARYKLKITSDKVVIEFSVFCFTLAYTMIILSISLLDDLDKELNTYTTSVCELYGLHFPELANIVQDNILYAKVVKLMGNRINAATLDFSEILADEVEAELKEASMVSTRTEVSDLDLMHIQELCDQVLSIAEDKTLLCDDLKNKMNKIAPNLTALVGELVGARLISHCGSLWNLSKLPWSTIQILGAEKTLYKALKTKQATPKYGLIYHAPLVRQAAPENKGKIARSLAAKSALAIRCDAFGNGQDNTMGVESRLKLEARLRNLEGGDLGACEEEEEVNDKDTKKEADDEEEPKTEECSKKRKKEAELETVEDPAKKSKQEGVTGLLLLMLLISLIYFFSVNQLLW
ncbi:similar to S. cerevisiae SIK1P (PID:g984964) [Arabidopsis thaliana]|nr:similar to S. cerevisiae SIK1P (PID:g984964) [Arabidopsis thaliana]